MTTFWSDRSKISLKTDLVLELIDGFTNQLIGPCRQRFFINDRPAKVTRNKNGLMVFCNLIDTPKRIRIEFDIYQNINLDLSSDDIERHKAGNYIHKILRLHPSRRYNLPSWATVVEGRLGSSYDEKSIYEAIVSDVTDVFRIKKTSEDGKRVDIHLTNNDLMIGRQFFDADLHPAEAFFIVDTENETFLIDPEAKNPLEAHALLNEIRRVPVDENGTFMVSLSNVAGERTSFKLYKDKQKIGEFQIEAGKWNDVGPVTT